MQFSFKDGSDAFKRLFLLIIGSLFSSIAINGFLRPAGLISSGITGLSIIANHLTGMNIGIIVFVVNVPLFIIAYFNLKKEFVLYSLVNMMIFSALLGFTGSIYKYIELNDALLSAITGGVLNGIGMGITFRARGSQGGIDIIGVMIRRKWEISIGNALMILDFLIVLTGGYFLGIKSFLYTYIAIYISYFFLDQVQAIFNRKKSILIISNESETIGNLLIYEMNRAVTYIDGHGGYSGKEKKIIYTIIYDKEIPKIKGILKKVDPKAFISVLETSDIKGYRFEERFV